jgi:hypothetical protein
LTSTNASPIYVALFLTGNYILQRPCIYCSLLLSILVFSLFDFHADWFEPRWSGSPIAITETATSFLSGNATFTEAIVETASLAVAAINGTGGSLASVAIEEMKRKMATGGGTSLLAAASNSSSGFEWIRASLERRQFRIPCVEVIVRI